MLKFPIIIFVLTAVHVRSEPPGPPAACPSPNTEDKSSIKLDKFDLFEDCKTLCDEITGSKWYHPIDPKVFVQMLCHRNWDQRNQIQQTFPLKCDNRVLLEKIEHINLMMSECKHLMKKLLTSPVQIYKQAIEGEKCDNHDDDIITLLICSANNKEKTALLKEYPDLHKVLEDYASKGGEGYKALLTGPCFIQRKETPDPSITDQIIQNEANELKSKNGPEFVAKLKDIIFGNKYGDPERKRIFLKFTELQQDYEIADKIKESFQGKEMQAYMVLARSIQNKYKFYAMALNHCIKGGELKTNIDCVNIIVTTRCEIDLGNIANSYTSIFHKKFTDDFKDCFKIDGLYYEAIRKLFGDYE